MNNVLLIMPEFFTTKNDVVSALKSNGYNVVSFPDRPSENNLIKALIRYNRKFVACKTTRYVKKIVKENKGKHFYRIIMFNGQSFTDKHVKSLLDNISHDKSIYYMWDALSFLPYSKKLLKLFDYSVTFNIYDYKSKEFDYFLPLYIPPEYNTSLTNKEYKWDLAFIGTGKPEKINFIKSATKYCEDNNLRGLFHVYLPSKLMYMYNKLFKKEYRGLKRSFFKFYKLNHDEIKNIYSRSKCVLDSGSENEGGLPLRVFEILGLNKKLILVNKSIEHYAFYRKEQFLISNGELQIDDSFLRSPLPQNENIELFRINNWVQLLVEPENIKIEKIIKE